jgi:Mce-associated membrane protein
MTKEAEVKVTPGSDAKISEDDAMEDVPGSEDDDIGTDAAGQNDATADEDEDAGGDGGPPAAVSFTRKHGTAWSRVLVYGILPGLALVLALAAGYLKWQDSSARDAQLARMQSVAAAKDTTVTLLSYRPDTVEKDLGAASDRLTGDFRNAYTSLTHDVVIPGSKQKRISAIANVGAAASVSATENHATVLVFVNQTIIVGAEPPSDTASSVRLTLDKIGERWLISGFEPV